MNKYDFAHKGYRLEVTKDNLSISLLDFGRMYNLNINLDGTIANLLNVLNNTLDNLDREHIIKYGKQLQTN